MTFIGGFLCGLFAAYAGPVLFRRAHRHYGLPPIPDDEIRGIGA